MSAFAYSRTALVKKNVCTSEDDKVLYKENHYMSEMHFLPNPGEQKFEKIHSKFFITRC